MLTGTLVTVAGFVPIGFAKSGAGEYCYSLFAVIAVALVGLVDCRGGVCPGYRRDDTAKNHEAPR